MKKMIFFLGGLLFILTFFPPLFSEEGRSEENKQTLKPALRAENDIGANLSLPNIRKKIPLHVMEAFLKDKSKSKYRIIDGGDVLVPAGLNVVFNLDTKNHKFLIKTTQLNGGEEVFKEFRLKVLTPSRRVPDINSGSRLSLVLRERFISVKLMGRTLESGNIGDTIRVRAYELARNFKVRLIGKNEGEILP